MKSSSALFRRTLSLGILIGITFSAIASAAPDVFEGRVKMRMTEGASAQSIDYFIKDDQMRIEIAHPQAGGGAMIMDMKKKEMIALMPEQKMYITMPLPDPGQTASEESDENAPEPTGETKSLLGYTAQKYLFQESQNEYEIWATDELGTFGGLHIPGGANPGALSPREKALAGQDFFPLLIVERRNGREATRIEVTEIEKKRLSDTLFKVPSGFQKMESPFQLPQ